MNIVANVFEARLMDVRITEDEIVAHLVDVSIPTTTNTRDLLAEQPGRKSQVSTRRFQTSSARHQAAGFKTSEFQFLAPRSGSAPACPGHGRNNSRGTAETAAGSSVESSAENPKSDERTKGEPGGNKFGTCSEI